MRKLITSIILLIGMVHAYGQTELSQAEYFIDLDPGFGNATSIELSGIEFSISEIIVQSLDPGEHTLFIRTKDINGVWGITTAQNFFVNVTGESYDPSPVTEAEYFIDFDPGYGAATPLTFGAGHEVDVYSLIDNNLTPGFHTFHIRTKNADGLWGLPVTQTFYNQEGNNLNPQPSSVILGYEYFIGDDPGVGAAEYIETNSDLEVTVQNWIESQELENGTYQLSIRPKNSDNTWGLAQRTSFEFLNCEESEVTLEGDTEFCSESTSILSAPAGYEAWYWNTQALTETIIPTESGFYNVSVYDEENHQCFHSNDLEIEMFDPIEPSFETVISFEDATFTSNVEGSEYLWTVDGTDFTSDPELQFGFAADGEHEVCLSVTNICGTYQHCETIFICSEYEIPPVFYIDADGDGFGVETDSIQACTLPDGYAANNTDCDDSDAGINPDAVEIEGDEIDQNCDGDDFVNGLTTLSESEFRVYPNPTNDIVNIAFDRGFNGTIQVFDMRGKRVFHQDLIGTLQLPIDLSNLSTGFYVLRVHNDQVQAMRRISVL